MAISFLQNKNHEQICMVEQVSLEQTDPYDVLGPAMPAEWHLQALPDTQQSETFQCCRQ